MTAAERKLLYAFDLYYAGNSCLGDFENELKRIAEAVGEKHSKNTKALKGLHEAREQRWATAEVMAGRKSKRLDKYLEQFKP